MPDLPANLTKRNTIILHTDVVRMLKVIEELDSPENFAQFLDDYYNLCSNQITASGGEVIKYMGDACIAIFDDTAVLSALEAVTSIRDGMPELCRKWKVSVTDVKAALHIGEVIVGSFGPEGLRDILGHAVNIVFRIEGEGRVVMSETLYRKLPSDKRGPWKKRGGRVVYVME